MNGTLNDLIDSATIALTEEGVPEREIRDAIVSCLGDIARRRIGANHELAYILDKKANDYEIISDLDEYNSWTDPNTREHEDERRQ